VVASSVTSSACCGVPTTSLSSPRRLFAPHSGRCLPHNAGYRFSLISKHLDIRSVLGIYWAHGKASG
jgi:hypothetical protein